MSKYPPYPLKLYQKWIVPLLTAISMQRTKLQEFGEMSIVDPVLANFKGTKRCIDCRKNSKGWYKSDKDIRL